jgi:predicted metal-dependent phosphoesterase TrpH
VSVKPETRGLLSELHAHSTWSDGQLSLRELVDLYGGAGFDVLCITDHALANHDPWLAAARADGVPTAYVSSSNHAAYLEAVEAEAQRARAAYGLLVIPGLELTVNDRDPDLAAHAVALGLRDYVAPELGIREAMRTAREAGAAVIAAHPHGSERDAFPSRTTRRFWRDWEELAPHVDRVELFNRDDVFSWVAAARLPAVASGDFHRQEHLSGWKTLIPCPHEERAVVDYLRSSAAAYLLPFYADPAHGRAAA